MAPYSYFKNLKFCSVNWKIGLNCAYISAFDVLYECPLLF
jgi:hypothetical protein